MIYTFFLVIHVLISIFLVVTVLMQASKGGGLAGIAGTGSSSASFGGRQTATLLHKVTVGLAVAFAANCLLLGILSKGRSTPRSVVQETQADENPLDFLPNVDLTDQQMQGGQDMPDQTGGGMQVQMETAPAGEGTTAGEDQEN